MSRRDADATRGRILDAATDEFAERGIAGARVDRIAERAQCNKALLYAYFGNKDALFDIVFTTAVARLVADTPLDADRLDEYAGRLVDYYAARPEVVRLALWDRLERDGAGMRAPAVVAAEAEKVAAIAQAQRDGSIRDRFEPAAAYALITALTSLLPMLMDRGARPVAVRAVAALLRN